MDVNAMACAVRRNLTTDEVEQANPFPRKIIMQAWTPHDLRRTTATEMSVLGYSDEIIDAILNHCKKGVIGIYNRNKYDREKQMALESWARKLDSIITGGEIAKIVTIRRTASYSTV